MDALPLLPAPDEIVRCAEFSAGLGVDPVGTAIRADLLIAADTPLPWPKPVFDHPLLRHVPAAVAGAPVPTRVLASVPEDRDALRIVAYRRSTGAPRPERAEWVTDAAGLPEALAAVIGGERPPDADVIDRADAPELWVCTQGSHDVCCGSHGSRFATTAAAGWGTEVRVRRVSHTGGHRFAPTAVSWPDGRMWAYLDVGDIAAVAGLTGEGTASLAAKCRGWWGADTGPAQAAEREGLGLHGAAWDHSVRRLDVEPADVTGAVTVRVEATLPDGRQVGYRCMVETAREVPTITCGAPGGLPAKPGRELMVTHVESL